MVGLALGWAMAAAATGPPEAAPEAARGVFFESLDVELVTLDVFVTDAEGRPARGLGRERFRLRVDGRPVEITTFEAVDRDRERAGETRPSLPAAGQEASPESIPPSETPDVEPSTLVVYVDNLQIRPFDRTRVLNEVRELLRRLPPQTRTMVVSFDRSLHVRQGLTADARSATAALSGLTETTGFGVQSESERRQLLRHVEQSDRVEDALALVELHLQSVQHEAEQSLRALDELIGSLGGLPGRKALLYVGEGVPRRVGEDLFQLLESRFGRGGFTRLAAARYRLDRQLRTVTGRANANRVTLYTISARGMRSASSVSAEHGGSRESMVDVDAIHQMERWAALGELADETGGLSALNTNAVAGALGRIEQDLETYYTVGYRPAAPSDGRYHELEVTVDDSALRVRYRPGYRAKTALARLRDGLEASALYGVESNRMGIRIRTGAPARGPKGWLVPLTVEIPIRALTLVPRGGAHEGSVRVAVLVRDAQGGRSEPEPQVVPIRIPDADLAGAQSQHFAYDVSLLVAPGPQAVVVGLRDEISGETAFVTRGIRVGD